MPSFKAAAYAKFLVYLVVVLLINIVGLTLFARVDLTRNDLFSLSQASRRAVASLNEPLTINVFFTRNLPAPHNGTERYLHDLLAEYARHGGRHFNYRFYDVSPDAGDTTAEAEENRRLAHSYGIHPVQIQVVDRDEIKFKQAYMGMVMIHGDLIERLDAITSTDGLEYRITTAIEKMSNKTSALLAIEDEIQVALYLSRSLLKVAPLMGLKDLASLPETLEALVARINPQHYGKLRFEVIDPPADQDPTELGNALDIMTLKWPDTPEHRVSAGSGVVGLVLRHGQRHVSLPVVQVFQLPIFGTQYQLAGEAELTGMLEDGIESLIDINADLGVMASHGTLPLVAPPPQGRPEDADINALRDLVSQNYTLKAVDPAEGGITPGFETLLILRPREKLSDFDLYQIDQFLMRGGNLFIAIDTFKEEFPAGGMPVYKPVDSGLEQMLAHWGVKIDDSYVMDEKCYRQRLRQDMGGGEQTIHFAPLIENQNIHHGLPFMQNIRGLVAFMASPLELDRQRLDGVNLSAEVLFSSSDRSWRMGEPINLNPMFSTPPPESEMEGPLPLAVLVEGEFPSYFKGKPMPARPEKPASATGEENDAAEADASTAVQGVAETGAFIERGRPAKIFVMASAEMLTDKILDPEGRSPNSIFVLNAIDYLNERQDVAILRSKEQRFNPLDPVAPETRSLVKAVNIAGLPILVVGFGLLAWLRRSRRKRRIQDMFRQEGAR
jgi:ABC-2 type transport system permease protein